MPHAHLLYINKIKEHLTLAGLSTYKKLNPDPFQAIRNGVLSTLDFLDSAHLVDHRTRNHLTAQGLSCISLLYPIFCCS